MGGECGGGPDYILYILSNGKKVTHKHDRDMYWTRNGHFMNLL